MKKFFSIFALALCILCMFTVYSVSVQKNLSDNIVRLHIIANSNSPVDQSIKLAVRDEILSYAKSSKTPPDAEKYAHIAQNYLKKINAPYQAGASIEYCYVPTKSYKSVTLPQGKYNCIKVVLGNGSGENWWCIAYPPLCYTESMFGDLSKDGKHTLSELLDKETLYSITQSGEISFRFKIVDEIQRILNKFSKDTSSIQ